MDTPCSEKSTARELGSDKQTNTASVPHQRPRDPSQVVPQRLTAAELGDVRFHTRTPNRPKEAALSSARPSGLHDECNVFYQLPVINNVLRPTYSAAVSYCTKACRATHSAYLSKVRLSKCAGRPTAFGRSLSSSSETLRVHCAAACIDVYHIAVWTNARLPPTALQD